MSRHSFYFIFIFIRRALQRHTDKESVHDFDEMKGIENNGNDGQDRPANDDIYSNEAGMWIKRVHLCFSHCTIVISYS
jgi:hypothetical protein